MKNSTFNDLLTVQIQSTNIEHFDPDDSIQCWIVVEYLVISKNIYLSIW